MLSFFHSIWLNMHCIWNRSGLSNILAHHCVLALMWIDYMGVSSSYTHEPPHGGKLNVYWALDIHQPDLATWRREQSTSTHATAPLHNLINGFMVQLELHLLLHMTDMLLWRSHTATARIHVPHELRERRTPVRIPCYIALLLWSRGTGGVWHIRLKRYWEFHMAGLSWCFLMPRLICCSSSCISWLSLSTMPSTINISNNRLRKTMGGNTSGGRWGTMQAAPVPLSRFLRNVRK